MRRQQWQPHHGSTPHLANDSCHTEVAQWRSHDLPEKTYGLSSKSREGRVGQTPPQAKATAKTKAKTRLKT